MVSFLRRDPSASSCLRYVSISVYFNIKNRQRGTRLAQSVERPTSNLEIVGSIPTSAISFFSF